MDVEKIKDGYSFDGAAITLGALIDQGNPNSEALIRIPLSMLNRHGLVAGATGTGKTRTLQLLAESLSGAGVPVFAADIKGDLTGMAVAGEASEKLLKRVEPLGQSWQATRFPVELYALGGDGNGIPIRATVSDFGPTLLSKVLELNQVQESSLGLIFMYADKAGLPLLDLKDLVELLKYLTSDEGSSELKNIGGISSSTAGVILRSLMLLNEQGGDKFFGEPAFEPSDLLKVDSNGLGIISLLELPNVVSQPQLFSTFLMWLLAELFEQLPEVGDLDKPKLVFFFDEAHLLFTGASKSFLESIVQTVRLIRSKGVGVFFVTQTPKDVHDDVLAQLGSRIQHQLRAHTPNDVKALKATVATYPNSDYDLERVLQELGIGEAIVTVMGQRGAPTPVAWTRLWAPQGSMDALDADQQKAIVQGSGQLRKYGEAIDRESAYEMLTKRLTERQAQQEAAAQSKEEQARQKELEKIAAQQARERERAEREALRQQAAEQREAERRARQTQQTVGRVATTIGRELVRGLFGILRGRR